MLLHVLLLVILALAAAFICTDAARAPATLEEDGAAAPDRGHAPAGSDAMPVEHVVVVDKRRGGGGGHSSGGGGHSIGGSRGRGFRGAGTGYHGGHGSARSHNSAFLLL